MTQGSPNRKRSTPARAKQPNRGDKTGDKRKERVFKLEEEERKAWTARKEKRGERERAREWTQGQNRN